MGEQVPRRELLLKVGAVVLLVAAVSALHYTTQTTRPLLHDVYRRLYYLPVGLAAVWFGVRGGLAASAAVALAYVPHILLDWHHVGREVANQYMEVALYFLFSGVTGYFAGQERRLRVQCQVAAATLDRSYQDLRRQADLVLEIEDQLRRADRLSAVGQLAAAMTHEIRNPLGSIRGAAEILRDDFPPGHPKAEFLQILVRETERLNRVVEDFLGFTRQRGQEEGGEAVDLGLVAQETLVLLESQARKAGVRAAWEGGADASVVGSSAQLRQVVLNLLLNAVQATPEGGRVCCRVEVRPGKVPGPEFREVDGQLAVLVVEDEGPGVGGEAREHLFEPFYTTKPEGTGLGLAISQRIARAHDGRIEVAARDEGGARFSLVLPLREPEPSTEERHA